MGFLVYSKSRRITSQYRIYSHEYKMKNYYTKFFLFFFYNIYLSFKKPVK